MVGESGVGINRGGLPGRPELLLHLILLLQVLHLLTPLFHCQKILILHQQIHKHLQLTLLIQVFQLVLELIADIRSRGGLVSEPVVD